VLGPVHPAADVDPDDGTEVNDGSLVARASTAAGTVLLAGDVELSAQSDLLASGADLRADVLKMPHHGSRYSSEAFLDAVRPRVVLVSVGAGNRYGHPDTGLLGRLERAGALVRRTDVGGDVVVVATGDGRAPGTGLQVVARGDPLPASRRRAARGTAGRRSRSPPVTGCRRAAPRPGVRAGSRLGWRDGRCTAQRGRSPMRRESVNPWEWGLTWSLDQAELLTDVSRQLRCSGQVSLRPDPESPEGVAVVAAGDMRGQMECSLTNVDAILWKARMRRENVVGLRFYATDVDAFLENYDVYTQWIAPAGIRPPQSLLGIQRLALPELMVSIEAVAVD
jgi:enamine deaminase RidA (YjgF/YER057c/UK114 family)